MSIINVGDFPIDPYVVDGVELAARLNRLKLAIYSGLSNASRPADIMAGGTWVKFTAPSTYMLMLYNGVTDSPVAVGDVTSGAIALPFNTATDYETGDLIWDAATGTVQSAKYQIASGGAYNAGDWNPNQNIADSFVKKTGDTLTGPLVLSGDASTALEAVPKQQLDATVAGAVASAGTFKNKIIGGDFTTNPWQRGTSFPAVGSVYTADRFRFAYILSGGQCTVSKTADAPTVAQAGVFTQHCFHVDVTTAQASMAAGDVSTIVQTIEGLNAVSLGFGQPGTRYVTLSFWVKATKTGVYCASLRNAGQTRSYVAEYTVTASNTWEKKVIQFPVDTGGTWLYDNGVGVYVAFTLAVGATLVTTPGSWKAGDFVATANQVNALDSTANDFKLALVQLEAGQVADPVFEAREVGDVLRQCQRYYFSLTGINIRGSLAGTTTMNRYWSLPLPVTMRATPTVATALNTGTFVNESSAKHLSGYGVYADTVTIASINSATLSAEL